MATVSWSGAALNEIEGIRQYVAEHSASAADMVIDRIVAGTERLETFPGSGRILLLPGRSDIREIIVGRYRVVYQLLAADVRILMVRHTARSLSPGDLAPRL